ncbi:glycosyltransferase family 4 protein [Blastopirellula retiformator]|uniref:glycosyltransferase family 4 protein n=1 Tax=Blastopirellula retiformator TaxID=2527970 RepID=UPI0011B4ADFB|nr:glycosyltransferase family 1 protein [Blastopirellula retiformator]
MSTSSTESACLDLGILCDFREEKWASMDLAAEMLDQEVGNLPNCDWRPERIVPKYQPRFTWAKSLVGEKRARNIDRLYNRMRVYPRQLAKLRPYSFYHVCDHSYAHLLHGLPAGKAGVFCHDLDTFRCLIQPDRDPRPWWFRRMTQSILDGMRKAAVVFHPTMQTRREILEHGLVPAEKLVFAPNGVASEFNAEGRKEDGELLQAESPYLLNVGSCIPRKRIDLLLRIFAHVQPTWPGLRLLQIGGQWTVEHETLLDELQIRPHVTQLRGMTREQLAEYYRQAAIVVQPTEAEGFGLPIVEAIACGALVVASDIPVLREVGGEAVTYAPVGDVEEWGRALMNVKNGQCAGRSQRQSQAEKFTWQAQAEIIVGACDRLASDVGGQR